jgi:hypothetical protein
MKAAVTDFWNRFLLTQADQALQKVHWEFFAGECQTIGRAPSFDMEVICEIFKLVYSGESHSHQWIRRLPNSSKIIRYILKT